MTDTIGWGDVDAEPKRRRRVPRRVVWPAVAVVAVVAALAPVAERRRGADDARSLQHLWARQIALEASRQSMLSSAMSLLGIGDAASFVDVLRSTDREEAGRLEELARSLPRQRASRADVRKARAAVGTALRAEVAALRDEAQQAPQLLRPNLYVPLLPPATETLLSTANALVVAAARGHHLTTDWTSHERLHSPAAFLARLQRPTDQPLALRLAVVEPNGLTQWDVATGRSRHVSVDVPGNGGSYAMPVVASQLLLQQDATAWLVPLDGGRVRKLPAADVYLHGDATTLWRVSRQSVWRYDAVRHVLGPETPLPSSFLQPFAAFGDALVVNAGPSAEGMVFYLWRPRDGSLRRIAATCDGVLLAAAHAVVYNTCDSSALVVRDVRTWHVTTLRPPRGYVFTGGALSLSPNGQRVATGITDEPATVDGSTAIAVYDLSTGHVDVVDDTDGIDPVGWSPDSTTLLLAQLRTGEIANRAADKPLAYWHDGMTKLGALRIPVDAGVVGIAVLP